MTRILRLAWRLWRSNPRVFSHRLRLVLRSPLRNAAHLLGGQRRERRINATYTSWLDECQALEAPPPPDGPLLSVVMPVRDVAQTLLDEAVGSVLAQTYPRWELCIADDASTLPHIRPALERYASADPRVRVTYRETAGHISAASNSALTLASGDFILLLDHDDRLLPEALSAVARAVIDHPRVDLLYSDEEKLSADGCRIEPFFKPAWSPVLFTSTNYLNHLVALRRSLVLEVGGFRQETVGSQDYDLLLRVEERAQEVAHLPRVLYSWRMAPGSTAIGSAAKPYAVAAARRALTDAVTRRGLDAEVTDGHLNGQLVLRRRLPARCRVSLVLFGEETAWQGVGDEDGIDLVDAWTFDAAPALPEGVRRAASIDDLTGEWLVLLDTSQRPTSSDALRSLLEPLQDEAVAITGGCTVGRDGTILQAGIALAAGGQPVYLLAGLPALPLRPFYLNFKDLSREVAAVSAGCCAIRRDTWRNLGGWSPNLAAGLAMTDLCLRAFATGRSCVYAPMARFERAAPLPPLPAIPDAGWPWRAEDDPFWSPMLSAEHGDGLPFRCLDGRAARVRPARAGLVERP